MRCHAIYLKLTGRAVLSTLNINRNRDKQKNMNEKLLRECFNVFILILLNWWKLIFKFRKGLKIFVEFLMRKKIFFKAHLYSSNCI